MKDGIVSILEVRHGDRTSFIYSRQGRLRTRTEHLRTRTERLRTRERAFVRYAQ